MKLIFSIVLIITTLLSIGLLTILAKIKSAHPMVNLPIGKIATLTTVLIGILVVQLALPY